MQSLPAAMTWQLFARGKWHLTLATLGAIAWPAMIFSALKRDGALIPADSTMLSMHTILALVTMFCCGAAIVQAQGKISKLYTYPLTNIQIVTSRLLPAMAIIVVQMAAVLSTLNAIYRLDHAALPRVQASQADSHTRNQHRRKQQTTVQVRKGDSAEGVSRDWPRDDQQREIGSDQR